MFVDCFVEAQAVIVAGPWGVVGTDTKAIIAAQVGTPRPPELWVERLRMGRGVCNTDR